MSKIVFFGTESESALVLEKLITNNFEIVAVVSKPDSPRGRGQKIDSPAVKKLAEKHGLKILQPDKLVADDIPPADIGILVSYGKIIPQSVIDVFPRGIINIHPSILPKYRGPSPIETVILNGDGETGVSIMSLNASMDAGPVYVQEKIALDGTETSSELYEKLFNLGAGLLINNLNKIISGELSPTEQNDSRATYCKLLKKNDGDLDPNTMTSNECERRIRAFVNFPKTRLNFMGVRTIVTRAKVLHDFSGDNWPDVVRCADNTALQIIEIISPNSGKRMEVVDYLRGLHV